MKDIKYLDILPQEIANYFLSKENHNISNLKLNKLIYISFGWVCSAFEAYLFEEKIEPWEFGPVIPSIYHQFKVFGRKKIEQKAVVNYKGEVIEPMIDTEEKQLIRLIDDLYEFYNISPFHLVDITHEKDSPWSLAKDKKYNEIPKENIYNYYQQTKPEPNRKKEYLDDETINFMCSEVGLKEIKEQLISI